MDRSLARRLAWLSLALVACHPRGSADGPRNEHAAVHEPTKAQAIGVLDLAVGRYRTCAVRSGGELRCWGDNQGGVLGDGTERTRRYPHPVQGITDATQVALDQWHTCARHRDGRVSCWGRGASGQLGDGTLDDRSTPVEVKGLRDAADVGVGGNHSCAVRTDGSVWCWGANELGQLGDGTLVLRATPVEVKGLPRARRVLPGLDFTCAWLRDDSVWCWGSDAEGLTGRAEPAPRCGEAEWAPGCSTAPRGPVPIPPVIDVAVGERHACAVTREGQVRCWGNTFACEHGMSRLGPIRAPRTLESLPPVASLAGPQCARARSGELVCWGRDPAAPDVAYDGGPAYACTTQRVLPELTREATQIAAHEAGGCLVRTYGAGAAAREHLWCWGEGGRGQLGDGSEVSRPAGVLVALHFLPPPPGPTPLQAWTRAHLVRNPVRDRGYALVWHDAPIYPDAGPAPSVGAIADHPAELRGDGHDGRLPVRIVARHGGRLEVEPLDRAAAAEHCGGSSFSGFGRYALRMFVSIEDLAPVIAREYAMGYPDGSGVTLGAGVPLRPLEAGVVVRVGTLVLPLELTEGDAALTYEAPGLRTRAGGNEWELPMLAPQAVLTLDDRRVYVDDLPERLTRVRWIKPEQTGVARVHTEDHCVGLDMIADEPVPTTHDMGGAGMLGLTETVSFTRVRDGAAAYWPGGARAGQLRVSYRTREVPRPDGERLCLTLAGALLICHDTADLATETDEVWYGEDQ